MSNICLVILVGIPGAGKTVLSKYISEKLLDEKTKIFNISYDDYESKEGYKTELYKSFRTNIYKEVETLLKKLNDCNNLSKDSKFIVVIDDNMYYRSMRRCYFNLAKKFTTGFCQIYVECRLEVALRRNKSRNATNYIPETVITEMASKIEPPAITNSWESYFCYINSEQDYTLQDFQIIKNVVNKAIENPEKLELSNMDKKYNHESFVHNVDLLLRKCINHLLKEAVRNKKQLAIQLVNKKKKIVSGLKQNEFFFPELPDDQLEKLLMNLIETM